ncbi:hypothetical protein E2562_018672 [Oryza meyeriana var. granulata]|uniref:glucose-1-phosphate adenylyltransferase n=1 Tax=Oryza meyeriana var. granulata TaxID=110450 RepID=A0A6G1BY66_9ORYZ|nr:hypothetical protein E2562_018672 [Oryza meyeriana var. granulata]
MVVAVILGGGVGTRLYFLTKRRAKPAVSTNTLVTVSSSAKDSANATYKLIDVLMRNCIISGINKVYILTQFNSASLNQYLSWMYNFSNGIAFGYGFVEVLTATQTPGSEGKRWFQGTGVRK